MDPTVIREKNMVHEGRSDAGLLRRNRQQLCSGPLHGKSKGDDRTGMKNIRAATWVTEKSVR